VLGILVSLAISIFYVAPPVWGNREIIRRLAVYEFFVAVTQPPIGRRSPLFFGVQKLHGRLLTL
jgi:hypothetical protein